MSFQGNYGHHIWYGNENRRGIRNPLQGLWWRHDMGTDYWPQLSPHMPLDWSFLLWVDMAFICDVTLMIWDSHLFVLFTSMARKCSETPNIWQRFACFVVVIFRDHFVYAASQWETTLHCNVIYHWLGAYTIMDWCDLFSNILAGCFTGKQLLLYFFLYLSLASVSVTWKISTNFENTHR